MTIDSVIIETTGRIHINSLMMNSMSGRGCGGLGLALDSLNLHVRLTRNNELTLEGFTNPYAPSVVNMAERVICHLGNPGKVKIEVLESFPSHVGLGLGTQIGLCLGTGISLLYDHPITLHEAARITGRAGVSGVGYYGFMHGGLIVEGGYPMGAGEEKGDFATHASNPPPLIGNYSFPEAWKVIVIAPPLSVVYKPGFDENEFFQQNTPIVQEEIDAICTGVLMGVIPSVVENRYFEFIRNLSHVVSIGTKKIELALNHDAVQIIMDQLKDVLAYAWVRRGSITYALQPTNQFVAPDHAAIYFDPRLRYLRDADKDVQALYPPDKIPFLALSSLGPVMYGIVLEGYHDIGAITKELERCIQGEWEYFVTSARNAPSRITYGASTEMNGQVRAGQTQSVSADKFDSLISSANNPITWW